MPTYLKKTSDLDPDGVTIRVQWGGMVVGSSIFVPCIDTERAKSQIKKVMKSKGWEYKASVVVENECQGVRVWRIL